MTCVEELKHNNQRIDGIIGTVFNKFGEYFTVSCKADIE